MVQITHVTRNPLVVAWRLALAIFHFTVAPIPSYTLFPCEVSKIVIHLTFRSLRSVVTEGLEIFQLSK